MKIIVAGCGNVGTNVVKSLAREGHSITAIDVSEDKLEEVADYYDATGVNGSASLLETLRDAEADKADLFIASMTSDEMNIMCCNLAKYVGAKATAARLRNPDYSAQAEDMMKALSLDFYVNPEYELACEIARKLKYPGADGVEDIVRGKAELITVTLPESCPLVGKKLMEVMSVSRAQGLVCVVERGDKVLIPRGNFVFDAGDKISFAATPKNSEILLHDIGLYRTPPSNIVIVGCGATAHYLAEALVKMNMHVKIMHSSQAECEKLKLELPDSITVAHGKATEEEIFEEEGLAKADAIILLNDNDEENILISLFARTYKIPIIITKVKNETNRKLLQEVNMGTVMSPDRTAATILIKYARALSVSGKRSKLIKLYNIDDKAEAVTFNVGEEKRIAGKKVREIAFKKSILCACIVRGGDIIIPYGDTEVKSGDLIMLVSADKRLTTLEEALER